MILFCWGGGRQGCRRLTKNHLTPTEFRGLGLGASKITALRRPYLYKKRRHPAPLRNSFSPITSQISSHPHALNTSYSTLIDSASTRDRFNTHFNTMAAKKDKSTAAKPKTAAAPVHASYKGNVAARSACALPVIRSQSYAGTNVLTVLTSVSRNGQGCYHQGSLPHGRVISVASKLGESPYNREATPFPSTVSMNCLHTANA